MTLVGLEPSTLGLLDQCDNHYTNVECWSAEVKSSNINNSISREYFYRSTPRLTITDYYRMSQHNALSFQMMYLSQQLDIIYQ